MSSVAVIYITEIKNIQSGSGLELESPAVYSGVLLLGYSDKSELRMYWLRLSRPASMCIVSSGLVGCGLRLRIPDVSPATVAGFFRGGCFNCCF